MQNKICLITGANAGVGLGTSIGLAKLGATVVMVARDPQRGQDALEQVKQNSKNPDVHLLIADLSSQAQVRQLAKTFDMQFPALHVLVNNAAIIPQERTLSPDGIELQLAVNHLAYFLLTNLLLDKLKASAPARIVNVASKAHIRAHLDLDDLQSTQHYEPSQVYNNSKLMNVLFTQELARRLEGTGVTVNTLHPGVVATQLHNDFMGSPEGESFSGMSLEQGAETPIYLASSPEVEGISGEYFERKQLQPTYSDSQNLAPRLWDISAEMVGLQQQV